MQYLINQLKILRKEPISKTVRTRLSEFNSFQGKPREDWFSELCFCILTANSRAKTAINIQNELGFGGFSEFERKKISETIMRNKHRFHNNKAAFIVEARQHLDIKDVIEDILREDGEPIAREWLVDNVKGLGYKESSHFLRNTGALNVAILDRHVLNLMLENEMLSERPKSLNRNNYNAIELKLNDLCKELKMTQAELDLYLWYMKTGEVLK
jgi:N-glycosylase/DNA lyase